MEEQVGEWREVAVEVAGVLADRAVEAMGVLGERRVDRMLARIILIDRFAEQFHKDPG